MKQEEKIEFWFDFGSPYAYFATFQIDSLMAELGRTVAWKPFLLGAAFQVTGMQPLMQTPLRGEYARRDWERLARLLGVPFHLPAGHPALTVAAGRAFLWLEEEHGDLAVPFAKKLFEAHFGRGEDIASLAVVVETAGSLGADAPRLSGALASTELKDRFRRRTDEAVARGVFGSPFIIVDGEPFWGNDRLPMAAEWVRRGGW